MKKGKMRKQPRKFKKGETVFDFDIASAGSSIRKELDRLDKLTYQLPRLLDAQLQKEAHRLIVEVMTESYPTLSINGSKIEFYTWDEPLEFGVNHDFTELIGDAVDDGDAKNIKANAQLLRSIIDAAEKTALGRCGFRQ